MRKSLALGLATVSLTGVGALVPAAANAACSTATATTGCTTTTVTIDPGSLTLNVSSAGSTVALTQTGTILPGSVVSGSLGTTSVSDTRSNSTGWGVSISATDFSDGKGNSFPVGGATGMTLAATPTSGTALPVTCGSGALVVTPAVTMTEGTGSATGTLATCAAPAGSLVGTLIGTNSASWVEGATLTVPNALVPGTYSSYVTQSVQ